VRELEFLQIVEVCPEERDGDLGSLLPSGRLESREAGTGKVRERHHGGEQAGDGHDREEARRVADTFGSDESHDGAFHGRGRRAPQAVRGFAADPLS